MYMHNHVVAVLLGRLNKKGKGGVIPKNFPACNDALTCVYDYCV